MAGFREKMNLPEFLVGIERLIEESEAGRQRLWQRLSARRTENHTGRWMVISCVEGS
jgi:hypothetical protein